MLRGSQRGRTDAHRRGARPPSESGRAERVNPGLQSSHRHIGLVNQQYRIPDPSGTLSVLGRVKEFDPASAAVRAPHPLAGGGPDAPSPHQGERASLLACQSVVTRRGGGPPSGGGAPLAGTSAGKRGSVDFASFKDRTPEGQRRGTSVGTVPSQGPPPQLDAPVVAAVVVVHGLRTPVERRAPSARTGRVDAPRARPDGRACVLCVAL